jgi:large subunit ribosomal protein L2
MYCSIIWGDEEKELHLIKLPTGKLLIVSSFCFATLGKNGNYWHKKEVLTKAGTRRIFGIRPTVRGVAMNPVDHPHGGRTKIVQPEVTPWGKIAKRGR